MEDVVGQLRVGRMAVPKHLKVMEGAGFDLTRAGWPCAQMFV